MRRRRAITCGVLVFVVLSPTPRAQLRLRPQVSGLTNPVAIVQDPTDRGVQLVVQQDGHIRVVRGATVAGDFLDLSAAIVSGGEQGLLSLAFAPDAATSGRV